MKRCAKLFPKRNGNEPLDECGCIRAGSHHGPHIFLTNKGDIWLWEVDDSCNCEDCNSEDPQNWCVLYWKSLLTMTLATALQNWRCETRAEVVQSVVGAKYREDWTVAGCGFFYLLGNGEPQGVRTFSGSKVVIPFLTEKECMAALVTHWLGAVDRNRERGMRRLGMVSPLAELFVQEISSGLSQGSRRARTYERVVNRLVWRCINRRSLLIGDMRLSEIAARDYLHSVMEAIRG